MTDCTQTPTIEAGLSKPLDPREILIAHVLSHLKYGTLWVIFPSGATRKFEGITGRQKEALSGILQIRRWSAIPRMLRGGSIGFAEGFMEGEWGSPNLPALLNMLLPNLQGILAKRSPLIWLRLFDRIRHLINRNSRSGSRKNIAYHYDLGNDFYTLWLDETMTYSAAWFGGSDLSLEDAQAAKYKRLAGIVGIQPEDHVLEIGCGWGGFAEYAVRTHGCKLTGLTLSKEQLQYARQRMDRAKLGDQAEFLLRDYRDETRKFDHIISIEMLEAVGEEYWPVYFETLKNSLRPGGRAGIQVITIAEDRFDHYRKSADFIQKYIFPGGMLPTDSMVRQMADRKGLHLVDHADFGLDYAKTLCLWRERFIRNKDQVRSLGYDQRFLNMWDYYLSYCEAGFRQKSISVRHYVFENRI